MKTMKTILDRLSWKILFTVLTVLILIEILLKYI